MKTKETTSPTRREIQKIRAKNYKVSVNVNYLQTVVLGRRYSTKSFQDMIENAIQEAVNVQLAKEKK